MRLSILERGHSIRTKALFGVIRVFSGHRVVDAVKLARYRPDFYRSGAVTQEAMRGASRWSIGDRELMAAVVSQANGTNFCVMAHSATAAVAYQDAAKVSAALDNLDTALIDEPLRATLRMLQKLTIDNRLSSDDVRAVIAAGASSEQIKDALAVALSFNLTDRLADAFDFAIDDPAAIRAGAKYLVSRGYR